MLVVVFGLPGSGKSYFARHLAEHLNAYHIKSDEVRAEMEQMGTYDASTKEAVYKAMLEKVRGQYKHQDAIVLDATFYKAHIRDLVKQEAAQLGAPLFFIRITANEDVIRQRVSRKREDSEADFKAYLKVKEAFDPVKEPHLELDSSDEDIERMLREAAHFLKTES